MWVVRSTPPFYEKGGQIASESGETAPRETSSTQKTKQQGKGPQGEIRNTLAEAVHELTFSGIPQEWGRSVFQAIAWIGQSQSTKDEKGSHFQEGKRKERKNFLEKDKKINQKRVKKACVSFCREGGEVEGLWNQTAKWAQRMGFKGVSPAEFQRGASSHAFIIGLYVEHTAIYKFEEGIRQLFAPKNGRCESQRSNGCRRFCSFSVCFHSQ